MKAQFYGGENLSDKDEFDVIAVKVDRDLIEALQTALPVMEGIAAERSETA